ncbi:site-specific integrase [Bosea sp. SSUT16]|uniref:Site-specific integrase n=1 Tax=Bosea spartocytisi TaxID=2773451 RepID=A0A927EFZ6_9HYPH|nr:site-specific integrase [Bosea spartocytisi]MBD3849406.1 site-specific integrase [Bosea spartocytisi]MCT4475003.1 site-specific integrase [Bosea spartocytisi]
MIDIETTYPARDKQLRAAAAIELGCSVVSHADYVNWLIDVRRLLLAASSWRQYRCAAAYVLEKGGTSETLAFARRLRAAKPISSYERKALPRRTSALKSKGLPQNDIDTLLAKIDASRSDHRNALRAYVQATLLTGLRPCEWPSVTLKLQDGTLILIVTNAKANDLRAHSLERTLLFDRLPRKFAERLSEWLTIVAAAGDDYPKLIKALGDALRSITRKSFPRRKRWPTLYTMRHIFAARAKEHYADRPSGLAIVAALLGHSSDATATHHYAKRRAGGGLPIPRANPNEVSLVRAVFKKKFDAFVELERGVASNSVGSPR